MKRYEPPHGDDEMREYSDGDWVRYDDIKHLLKDAERYRWLRTFINFAVTNDRLNDEAFPTLDHAVDYGMLAHDERGR